MINLNNNKSIFSNSNSNSFFGQNFTSQNFVFGLNVNNSLSANSEEEEIKDKNKNLSFKCNHINKYVAYNTIDMAGPVCYNCIHKYYLKNENCIPFEETIEYYKNIYQNYLNSFKEKINNIFNEFLEEIAKLNVDKFENFYALLNNLELNFELPIEVSMEERIEIGINKKLIKMRNNLNNKINNELPYNFINLYKTKMKDLKTKNSYSYENEEFILKSEIPFTLTGFAIPKIPEELKDKNKISFKSNRNQEKSGGLFGSPFYDYDQIDIKESKIKNNLAIIKLKDPIKIEKYKEYPMTLSGIKGLTYIDNEEKYNLYKKISIQNENKESILACLIIE